MFLQHSQTAVKRLLSHGGLTTTTTTTAIRSRLLLPRISPIVISASTNNSRAAACCFSTMQLIKDLRAKSGAPIVDCKKALAHSDNDMQAALTWLREHGAAKVSSKTADREASEGLVGLSLSDDDKKASLVLVKSETDFAGRSDAFSQLVTFCADAALEQLSWKNGKIAAAELLALTHNSKTVQTALDEAKVAIRENLQLGHIWSWSTPADKKGGVLVGYVHGKISPSINAGTAAALVDLSPTKAGTVSQEGIVGNGKETGHAHCRCQTSIPQSRECPRGRFGSGKDDFEKPIGRFQQTPGDCRQDCDGKDAQIL